MESKSRVFGIVSEFNPFHLGHEALLSACRAKGASRIICVMSGNFVQRGEAAVFSKWARAKAAVACGADLVLELPTSFAAAGAERFALGAVSILKDAGADTLAFGVESAEASELQTIAGYLRSDDFSGRLKAKLSQGVSFPAAREASVRDALGVRPAEILRDPNHILAIEYLKAAQTLDFHPALFPVRRVGAAHDSEVISGYAAKSIREALLRGEFPGETFPAAARDIFLEEIRKNRAPASLRTCERAILSYLRTEGAEAFHGISDLSEGIENAIVKSARTACTLDDLCSGAKSKRYSHARIRRLILAAFLRLRQNPALPLYLKPLAANDAGLSLLGKIESDASLPVITKYSEHRNLSCEALALYQEECRLSDQYALMLPVPASCGAEQRNSLFILR